MSNWSFKNKNININSPTFFIDEGEEGGEDGEELSPSAYDYVVHYISLFWKVLFAFCPPTGNNLNKCSNLY